MREQRVGGSKLTDKRLFNIATCTRLFDAFVKYLKLVLGVNGVVVY